jgi:uncharacterized protein YndB with AHSA1/START domain
MDAHVKNRLTLTTPSDREIVLTRTFDAPRALVWQAATDPKHVPHWWGPRGFTLPVCEIDLRVGGSWRYVNRDCDGKDHPFKGIYLEIVPPLRIVQTETYDVEPWKNGEAMVTMTLAERDGRTTLTAHALHPSQEARDAYLNAGMEKGAGETYDRLEEHLATMAAQFGEATVVITRVFDAPRALVWKAWTDPKMVAQWWGPKCFTNPVCEMDVRPGGSLFIVMRGPDGTDYPMKGMFWEIVAPERLVFTSIAVDKDGNHLLEGETTVTFVEHGGKTAVTVRSHAVGLVPSAPQMLAGMNAGWTQSIDKLEELVGRG